MTQQTGRLPQVAAGKTAHQYRWRMRQQLLMGEVHAQQACWLPQGAPCLSLQALDSLASAQGQMIVQGNSRCGLGSLLGALRLLVPQLPTLGCETAMFSMAMELIHSPPDLITSLLRSVMVITPNLSRVATSPIYQ